ncbi:uncharacterized protein LOC117820580 [Notolabrus celidotus]|uniref:uncharacterized protein LOC117820580 n=1 Tax=Notolabrus celidotus TaxID=1203425 RepID=UPI00148FBC1C|nr:uncharacterized protein LOC117820580 [Notolabrus celidotus]
MDLRLTVDEILDHNQQSEPEPEESPYMRLDFRTKETREMKSGPTSDEKSGSRSERTRIQDEESGPDLISRLKETKTPEPGSGSDLQLGSRSDLPLVLGLVKTRNLKSGETIDLLYRSKPDLLLNSRSEETKTKFGIRSGLHPRSASKLEETKDLSVPDSGPQTGSKSDLEPGCDSKLKPGSRPEETRNPLQGFKIKSEVWIHIRQTPGPRLDLLPGSRLKSAGEVESGSRLKEIKTLQFGIKLNMKPGYGSDLQPDCRPEETRDTESVVRSKETKKEGPRSDLNPGSASEETKDLQAESELDFFYGSVSEETREVRSRLRLDLMSEIKVIPEAWIQTREDPSPPSCFQTRPSVKTLTVRFQIRSEAGIKADEIRILKSGSTSVESKTRSQDPDLIQSRNLDWSIQETQSLD